MTLQKLLNHPIVLDMVCAGIEPKIKAGGLELDGFYKSGTVLLYMKNDETLEVISRYNEMSNVKSLKDLVELNYEWWCRTNARNTTKIPPVEPWKTLMLGFGLIKEVTYFTTVYEEN